MEIGAPAQGPEKIPAIVLFERLRNEVRLARQIAHPNVCSVYDIGDAEGRPFLSMEFIDGETLADRLSKGPLALDDTLKYGVQIADALLVHADARGLASDVRAVGLGHVGHLGPGMGHGPRRRTANPAQRHPLDVAPPLEVGQLDGRCGAGRRGGARAGAGSGAGMASVAGV